MEDRSVVASLLDGEFLLAACFDGHNGDQVAPQTPSPFSCPYSLPAGRGVPASRELRRPQREPQRWLSTPLPHREPPPHKVTPHVVGLESDSKGVSSPVSRAGPQPERDTSVTDGQGPQPERDTFVPRRCRRSCRACCPAWWSHPSCAGWLPTTRSCAVCARWTATSKRNRWAPPRRAPPRWWRSSPPP
eukprot:1194861-Prorocentrum_minimum.AAC.1